MNVRQRKYYGELVDIIRRKGGELLSDVYINTKTKVHVRCREGHKWHVIPKNIKNNRWCPVCSGKCPIKAKEDFLRIVREKGGLIHGKYINTKTKVKISCNRGHKWNSLPKDIKKGTWCLKCAERCPQQAMENFYLTVYNKGGTVLGTYTKSSSNVEIQCSCGNIWEICPGSIKEGNWCPRCSNCCPIQANERLYRTVSEKGGTLLTAYVSSNAKVRIRCSEGYEWEVTPNNIKGGHWCPHCKKSRGEEGVENYLSSKQIPFETQFKHPYILRRKYDFRIYHNNTNFIIEYDGIQHFKYTPHFHRQGEEEFLYRQEIDRIKTYVCTSTNCKVIRIDYTQIGDSIHEHLERAFELSQELYVSTPELYQGWLLDSSIDPRIYQEEVSLPSTN